MLTREQLEVELEIQKQTLFQLTVVFVVVLLALLASITAGGAYLFYRISSRTEAGDASARGGRPLAASDEARRSVREDARVDGPAEAVPRPAAMSVEEPRGGGGSGTGVSARAAQPADAKAEKRSKEVSAPQADSARGDGGRGGSRAVGTGESSRGSGRARRPPRGTAAGEGVRSSRRSRRRKRIPVLCKSKPSRAKIFAEDGTYLGRTPCTVRLLPRAQHLVFVLPGFRKRKVAVDPRRYPKVWVVLEPLSDR